ncbi:hypothetical protein GCM10023165_15860 [Variovorax defluvii]|uniref:Glycosyltransferase n=2 Tax=Variovorax defluvii TaxID=913761 RepID=A0ABP8HDP2_9BURK
MKEIKPRLALDAYVLAQGVKTGVYRVCDELFPRLATSGRVDVRFVAREGQEAAIADYLQSNEIPVSLHTTPAAPSADADVLLCPFGVAPANWRADDQVLKAHIIHDLIAIHRPEYFSQEASAEVRDIVAGLTEETVIFTISEHTRKDLLECRPDLRPEQITVAPLAASKMFRPCSDFAIRAAMREKYGIPAGVPYLLSVATLEIRKNLDQVVHAFLRFCDQHPESEMHLVLAGMAGWKLEKFDDALSAADDRDRGHRIIATGFVDDADLSALYSDAQCFVYLSRYEGFGLPPLEAMACGTPVICANNSSLPEVVGDAGLLLDTDDLQGVVQAIGQVAASETLRQELSRRGLARAGQFSWDRCAALVADTLVRAHAQRQAARGGAAPGRKVEASQPLGSRPEPLAGFLGYDDGAVGPSFEAHLLSVPARIRTDRPGWPAWTDRLPSTTGSAAQEGGLRTRGSMKQDRPGQPLVSYVTVVRNNVATLARTIESVQAQTYGNVEHIVLDGASSDGTFELVKAHGDRLDYFASAPDEGLYDALDKAVQLARGSLICVLNSDDWLEPQAAEIAVQRLGADTGRAALLLSAALVHAEGIDHPWRPAFVHPGSYFTCAHVCHNAIYATRKAYECSGAYDASLKIAADFRWIMTCLEAGAKFVYTKEATLNYSLGGTSSNIMKHSLECMRIVAERFPCLSAAEVKGLYDSFFSLPGAVVKGHAERAESHMDFLRQLKARHHDRADLLSAVGWASVAVMQHPEDVPDESAPAPRGRFARRLKDAGKSLLVRYPRLYGAAAGGYRRLKG